MKKNLVQLLGIAFVVAIVATGIFYGLFVSKLQSGSRSASGQSIVVAARAIDRGTALQKTDLKLATWPGGEIPKGAFTSVEGATGATVLHPHAENEPVLQSRLATAAGGATGTGGDLGIPTGMRAISVQVVSSSGIVS